MEKLTIQEEEVMVYIWRLGSCFVKDVLAEYAEPKPPYTTIASVFKNLQNKRFLKAEKQGNTYRYIPLVRESEYKRKFMSGFVRDYFKNSFKEMVTFFAKDNKISPEELKEIIQEIEKGKNE